MDLLSIIDAASITGKSIQTIRRMIKQKKVQVKKQKTPQGFNYLVVKESLLEFIAGQPQQSHISGTAPVPSDVIPEEREHRSVGDGKMFDFTGEVERFTSTIQKLIEQNERDKANFFQLVKTFQDRVFVLENQVKMLSAPRPRWWQFWKE